MFWQDLWLYCSEGLRAGVIDLWAGQVSVTVVEVIWRVTGVINYNNEGFESLRIWRSEFQTISRHFLRKKHKIWSFWQFLTVFDKKSVENLFLTWQFNPRFLTGFWRHCRKLANPGTITSMVWSEGFLCSRYINRTGISLAFTNVTIMSMYFQGKNWRCERSVYVAI